MRDNSPTETSEQHLEEGLEAIKKVADSFAADLENFELPKPRPSKDRLTYWFPKLWNGYQAYLPKTIVIPYNHFDFLEIMEEDYAARPEVVSSNMTLLKQCWDACVELMPFSQDIGVFVRTDLACAKHDGPKGYLIQKKEDVYPVLSRLVEDNEIKFGNEITFGFDSLIPGAFCFRQYLKLNSKFTAFGGLPIANELRMFVHKDKGVQCIHNYWPKEAIKRPSVSDWEKQLLELQESNLAKVKPFEELIEMASCMVDTLGSSETGDS